MSVAMTYKNAMLDALPGTVYVALFTGGAPGTGTEVAPGTLWGSGDRPELTVAAASDAARKPSADTPLGTVAVASQEVSHVAYYTAATGGALIAHNAWSRVLQQDAEVVIRDTQDVFRVDDPA